MSRIQVNAKLPTVYKNLLTPQIWMSRTQEGITASGTGQDTTGGGQDTTSGGDDTTSGGDDTTTGGGGSDTLEGGASGADTLRSADAPGWATRRIDDLTGKYRTEQRGHQATKDELAVAKAALEQLRRSGQDTTTGGDSGSRGTATPSADDIKRQVDEGVAAELYNRQCTEIGDKGRAAYGDWAARMAAFNRIDGVPPPVVEAAIATGKASELLYDLSGDLDEASRIFSLPPIQAGIALADRARKLGAKGTSVSNAGAGGARTSNTRTGGSAGGGGDPLAMNKPVGDWMAAREAQVRARQGRA